MFTSLKVKVPWPVFCALFISYLYGHTLEVWPGLDEEEIQYATSIYESGDNFQIGLSTHGMSPEFD